jgi:hypothetical protein
MRMVAALQPVERIMSNDLIIRARARLRAEAAPKQTLVAVPPPVVRVERVRVPVTCSARGQSYVVIAERRSNTLRFVSHEMPQPAKGAASPMPSQLSGEYQIEANGWRCPLCGNDAVWLCDCAAMSGAMHCCGSAGGRYRCACGRSEERDFVDVKHFAVRGRSVAATPEQARSGLQRSQPQLKQVTHDR